VRWCQSCFLMFVFFPYATNFVQFAIEWATTTCTTSAQDYQTRAPTSTSDRNCTPVTVCNSSQYELVAPTAFSDRICAM
jgi:hypothetical protein